MTYQYLDQPTTIKNILVKSWQLYKKLFLPLLPILIISALAGFGFTLIFQTSVSPQKIIMFLRIISFALVTLFSLYISVLIFMLAHEISVSTKVNLAELMKTSRGKLWRVIAAKIIIFLCAIALASFIGVIVAFIEGITQGKLHPFIFSSIIFVILILFFSYFWQAIPGILIDNEPLGLKKSLHLTSSNFLHNLLLLILAYLPTITLVLLTLGCFYMMQSQIPISNWLNHKYLRLVWAILGVIVAPWVYAVWLNTYHDLGLRKN